MCPCQSFQKHWDIPTQNRHPYTLRSMSPDCASARLKFRLLLWSRQSVWRRALMKNDETTRYYESPFAAPMADFIRYKRAQGLKYDAVPRSLRSFSRFLSAKEADDASIGKELIEEWCSFRPNENRLTQRRRIVETTQFLKYLSARGVDVHLPRPTWKSRTRGAFVPHIFSHEELYRFFEECDRISARAPSVMPVMLPVLFRLLLGCGLRISEALGLRLGDTDLDNGILVIRKSKFNKDRLIPLSDSLLAVLR